MTATADSKLSARRELTITRVIDAPRELVFKAWTDPKRMAQWWGPNGFTNPVCEMDVRPGGALRIVMRAPDGVDYPMSGVFREVAAAGSSSPQPRRTMRASRCSNGSRPSSAPTTAARRNSPCRRVPAP